jgi:hypothetical protein
MKPSVLERWNDRTMERWTMAMKRWNDGTMERWNDVLSLSYVPLSPLLLLDHQLRGIQRERKRNGNGRTRGMMGGPMKARW